MSLNWSKQQLKHTLGYFEIDSFYFNTSIYTVKNISLPWPWRDEEENSQWISGFCFFPSLYSPIVSGFFAVVLFFSFWRCRAGRRAGYKADIPGYTVIFFSEISILTCSALYTKGKSPCTGCMHSCSISSVPLQRRALLTGIIHFNSNLINTFYFSSTRQIWILNTIWKYVTKRVWAYTWTHMYKSFTCNIYCLSADQQKHIYL